MVLLLTGQEEERTTRRAIFVLHFKTRGHQTTTSATMSLVVVVSPQRIVKS